MGADLLWCFDPEIRPYFRVAFRVRVAFRPWNRALFQGWNRALFQGWNVATSLHPPALYEFWIYHWILYVTILINIIREQRRWSDLTYKEVALLRLSSSSSLDHTSDKFPLYSSLALLYPVTLFSSSDTLVKSLLSTPHCNCSVAGKLPQAFSQSSNCISTTLLWPLRLPESTTCLNFCLIAFSFVVNICLVTSSVCW